MAAKHVSVKCYFNMTGYMETKADEEIRKNFSNQWIDTFSSEDDIYIQGKYK